MSIPVSSIAVSIWFIENPISIKGTLIGITMGGDGVLCILLLCLGTWLDPGAVYWGGGGCLRGGAVGGIVMRSRESRAVGGGIEPSTAVEERPSCWVWFT